MYIINIIFWVSAFIIFWSMIGYSASLRILKRLYKDRKLKKDYSYQPTVTVMVVAHNEEKVIKEKLENITAIEYPKDKIEFLVTSDNSTDKTHEIVEEFIKHHSDKKVRLYKAKEHKGKTNAQNEAQKTATSEILVMTDANSMMAPDSVTELVAAFSSEDISYVCGRLLYVNKSKSSTANSESTYWDQESETRKIESNIQTITAGNGAIYACRNKEYYDFEPIRSHDSSMPRHYALQKKRALFNPDAVAYEKAGEVIEDEFKRKIRMNRGILKSILPDVRILNIFKYKWYSYFCFGHRTCRYLLWTAHLLVFASNIFLARVHPFYTVTLASQILFYLLAAIGAISKSENKYLKLVFYYVMTIAAQWVGVYNMLTGRAKPVWDKAESTR